MFNITKQGSSLLITSNDNSQFPWKDGQMSLPMNSVVYVIDESDYIAFRSSSNNDILFTALIDEIQINGTNVTKDDFILQFDNVANSAGGGGGSASAGVNSINGFQGDLTLKSINSKSLIGSGNIEVGNVSDLNFQDNVMFWNGTNGVNSKTFKTINGVSIFGTIGDTNIEISGGEPEQYVKNVTTDNVGSIYINNSDGTSDRIVFPLINGQNIVNNGGNIETDLSDYYTKEQTYSKDEVDGLLENSGGGSTAGVEALNIGRDVQDWTQKTGIVTLYTQMYNGGYEVAVDGMSFFGLKPADDTIIIEQGDFSVNDCFRGNIKVNEWTGTQSEYDALGTYDSGCTYYIIEG